MTSKGAVLAVQNHWSCGFRQLMPVVFVCACVSASRNEEMAANYLFEHGADLIMDEDPSPAPGQGQ